MRVSYSYASPWQYAIPFSSALFVVRIGLWRALRLLSRTVTLESRVRPLPTRSRERGSTNGNQAAQVEIVE
jgi:hypothetical protein